MKTAALFLLTLLLTFIANFSRAHSIDLKRLPLGDGKISSAPKKEWIWACRIDPRGEGARKNGPWIKSDGTFDYTAKAVVDGSVSWPYKFKINVEGEHRVFTSNDFPNHPTGVYPIAQSDDAFAVDGNPSRIQEQSMRIELPTQPAVTNASCAPGAVGILLSGAILFNALDAPGRDAVAHETQDSCQGHPQQAGVYHYHNLSSCVPDRSDPSGHSVLVGYALDGFGIFGHKGEGGKELTSADLDECHGHTHEIDWDGKRARMYHYHATWDFPYTIGCMRGAVKMSDVRTISGPGGGIEQGGPGRGPRRHPDLGIAARKLGISEEKLRETLGPPPPNLSDAAEKLHVPEEQLRDALEHQN